MATVASVRPPNTPRARDDRPSRRKKEQRVDIWSNLLRQTREAQARSRAQAVQSRNLILCGGAPDDQIRFVQSIARPPPPHPPARNQRDTRERRPKGEVVLSNQFAHGYGHVTLFSPPTQGAGLLGGESEEVAKLEVHTVPDADVGYEDTLRRLLQQHAEAEDAGLTADVEDDVGIGEQDGQHQQQERQRPAVVILLSWKEPWRFLDRLRKWLQLLSRALLPPGGPTEDPIEVLKEYKLGLTAVVQHVEAQEQLERENYKEESFDYISQCLRTCLLPISAALIYVPSATTAPANAQSAPLSELQKVIYTCLALDLSILSPGSAKSGTTGTAARKEDLLPKHNVVDRMAIVVPSGWDSMGKIRLLSETFSPETVIEGWINDINTPVLALPKVAVVSTPQAEDEKTDKQQAETGGAEQHTFETIGASSPVELPLDDTTPSPSKAGRSAISIFEHEIQDPEAHKTPQPPTISVTTEPEQAFLADMRSQLQLLEEKDKERQRREPSNFNSISASSRGISTPGGESSGALNNLGDVQFNVGGVNYNAVTAEAAIERLKRPPHPSSSTDSASNVGTPRIGTPRPPKRDEREGTPVQGKDTPKTGDMEFDRLEEYFHSLMKRGGGGSSSQSTPSKPPVAQ